MFRSPEYGFIQSSASGVENGSDPETGIWEPEQGRCSTGVRGLNINDPETGISEPEQCRCSTGVRGGYIGSRDLDMGT